MSALLQKPTPTASSAAAAAHHHSARIVVAVTIDRDGRKVLTVQSALSVVNRLPDAVLLKFDNSRVTQPHDKCELMVGAGERRCAPLRYVNGAMEVKPATDLGAIGMQLIDWRQVEGGGGRGKKAQPAMVSRALRFPVAGGGGGGNGCGGGSGRSGGNGQVHYWLCVCIKRERFPEKESLTGHTIYLLPPVTLVNMLPTDVELRIGGWSYPAAANGTVKAFNVSGGYSCGTSMH